MEKCPCCNSTRLKKINQTLKCDKCGFVNTNHKQILRSKKRKGKHK